MKIALMSRDFELSFDDHNKDLKVITMNNKNLSLYSFSY